MIAYRVKTIFLPCPNMGAMCNYFVSQLQNETIVLNRTQRKWGGTVKSARQSTGYIDELIWCGARPAFIQAPTGPWMKLRLSGLDQAVENPLGGDLCPPGWPQWSPGRFVRCRVGAPAPYFPRGALKKRLMCWPSVRCCVSAPFLVLNYIPFEVQSKRSFVVSDPRYSVSESCRGSVFHSYSNVIVEETSVQNKSPQARCLFLSTAFSFSLVQRKENANPVLLDSRRKPGARGSKRKRRTERYCG